MSFVPPLCWRSRLAALTVVALVVFLGHYLRLSSYGFYEDDYWAITPHLTQPLSYILDVLKTSFTYWPTGRPLNHSLPVALSIFGYKLGGLSGIYAIAYGWLTVNALLVYAIARRLLSGPSALLAAFVYVLFPADTTKILLTHAAHVQGSMTFLLVGIYLWQRGGFWRWVSYAIAALSLLSYESAFLPFLAVPLLCTGDRKSTWHTWLIHIGLCTLIISLIVAIRLDTGDVRANGVLASPSDTARMLLTSLYIGPITSLRMLGKGAWIGLQHHSYVGIGSAVFLLALVWMCRRFFISSPRTGSYPITPIWPHWLDRQRTEIGQLPWWWILIVALVMLAGSYALTLTNYPPTQESGRLTSTHVAAGWGMALAIAALYEGARRNLGKYASLMTAFVCIWVGCLLLYHDYNQREYTRAWSIQKEFWRQVVTLAPEADSGWSVIVTGNTAEQSTMIASNSWADFHVFSQFFNLGPFASVPAFAHLGVIGHLIRFQRQDGRWQWNPQFWGAPPEPLDRQRLILLHSENGVLSRIPFIDTQAGHLESAAPLTTSPTQPHWPQTTLGQIYFAEAAATP